MKIYTEIIYHWDDDKGELVQESEKSSLASKPKDSDKKTKSKK